MNYTELSGHPADFEVRYLFYSPCVRAGNPALHSRVLVVIEQQAILDTEVLRALNTQRPCLIALPEAGNYLAVGEVTGEPFEEEGDWTFNIQVHDALFQWTTQDKDACKPGDRVRFTVVGIVFWDMNL